VTQEDEIGGGKRGGSPPHPPGRARSTRSVNERTHVVEGSARRNDTRLPIEVEGKRWKRGREKGTLCTNPHVSHIEDDEPGIHTSCLHEA